MIPARSRSHRRWLLFSVLALFLGALHLAARSGAAPVAPTAGAPPDDRTVIPTPEIVPLPPDWELRTEFLGRGGTLASALKRLELPSPTRQAILERLSDQLDLRRLSPGTGLVAARDGRGQLRRLAVRAERDRFIRLHLDGPESSPRVELVELPRVTVVETAGGEVIHSVEQALADAGGGLELALSFADIFQWDIDLLVEPRTGDRVSVVYEVAHLGRVPDDLPPFGEAAAQSGERLGLGRILAASYRGRIASATAYWIERSEGAGGYFDEAGRPMRKTFLKSPLNYRRISSRFSKSRRHPVTRKVVPHHGIDFAAAPGTPVVAAASGTVVSAGWAGALGRAIRVRHGSHYETVYGHLRGLAKGIRKGAAVEQNQVIGFVGATGRATGPHLHYSLIERGRPVDPMRFRSPSPDPLPAALMPLLDWAQETWSPLLDAAPTPARRA